METKKKNRPKHFSFLPGMGIKGTNKASEKLLWEKVGITPRLLISLLMKVYKSLTDLFTFK